MGKLHNYIKTAFQSSFFFKEKKKAFETLLQLPAALFIDYHDITLEAIISAQWWKQKVICLRRQEL